MVEKFNAKFKTIEYKIYESEYWLWSLRPHQVTIGSGILSLKRECLSFSDLNSEEFTDLKNIVLIIEKTLKKIFNYDVINYMMLMMFDKHVHFHVLPRYKDSRVILNEEWKDENWPAIPQLLGESLTEEKSKRIIEIIQEKLEGEEEN